MVGLSGRTLTDGLVAGAAGTATLNVLTYLDMAVRGRPSSSTPEQAVETLAEKAHVAIPGDEEPKKNRVQGLGALLGSLSGFATGISVAVVEASSERRKGGSPWSLGRTIAVSFAFAMLAGNGPMTVLGVTDPRDWTVESWAADLIPHLGYGLACGWALHRLGDQLRAGPLQPNARVPIQSALIPPFG